MDRLLTAIALLLVMTWFVAFGVLLMIAAAYIWGAQFTSGVWWVIGIAGTIFVVGAIIGLLAAED